MPAPAVNVGRPIQRVEDPQLITGRDPYVNDVREDRPLQRAPKK